MARPQPRRTLLDFANIERADYSPTTAEIIQDTLGTALETASNAYVKSVEIKNQYALKAAQVQLERERFNELKLQNDEANKFAQDKVIRGYVAGVVASDDGKKTFFDSIDTLPEEEQTILKNRYSDAVKINNQTTKLENMLSTSGQDLTNADPEYLSNLRKYNQIKPSPLFSEKKNSILTDRFKEYNKNKSYYDLVNDKEKFEGIFPNVKHDQLAIIEPEQFSQYVITALRDNNKAKIEAGQINLNNYYKQATLLVNQIQARNDVATDATSSQAIRDQATLDIKKYTEELDKLRGTISDKIEPLKINEQKISVIKPGDETETSVRTDNKILNNLNIKNIELDSFFKYREDNNLTNKYTQNDVVDFIKNLRKENKTNLIKKEEGFPVSFGEDSIQYDVTTPDSAIASSLGVKQPPLDRGEEEKQINNALDGVSPLDDTVDKAEAEFITDPLADQDRNLFPSTNERLLERENAIKKQPTTIEEPTTQNILDEWDVKEAPRQFKQNTSRVYKTREILSQINTFKNTIENQNLSPENSIRMQKVLANKQTELKQLLVPYISSENGSFKDSKFDKQFYSLLSKQTKIPVNELKQLILSNVSYNI